jgi:hypothetical protein
MSDIGFASLFGIGETTIITAKVAKDAKEFRSKTQAMVQ